MGPLVLFLFLFNPFVITLLILLPSSLVCPHCIKWLYVVWDFSWVCIGFYSQYFTDEKVSVDAFGSVIMFTSSLLSWAIPASFHLRYSFSYSLTKGLLSDVCWGLREIQSLLVSSLCSCWLFIPLCSCNRSLFHQRLLRTSLKFTHWFRGLDSAFCLVHFFISCVFIWVVCRVFTL